MLFYTGTTLAAAMYIVGAVEIVLVWSKKLRLPLTQPEITNIFPLPQFPHGTNRPTWLHGSPFSATSQKTRKQCTTISEFMGPVSCWSWVSDADHNFHQTFYLVFSIWHLRLFSGLNNQSPSVQLRFQRHPLNVTLFHWQQAVLCMSA